jgi:hypothetical protein
MRRVNMLCPVTAEIVAQILADEPEEMFGGFAANVECERTNTERRSKRRRLWSAAFGIPLL